MAPLKSDMENEIRASWAVYNEAWGDNWGLDLDHRRRGPLSQAKNLKQVLDEELGDDRAEPQGEVVGAALTLPDINQVLAKLNVRLLPLGLAEHPLAAQRKTTGPARSRSGSSSNYQHTGRRRRPLRQDTSSTTRPDGDHVPPDRLVYLQVNGVDEPGQWKGMGGEVVKSVPDLREGARFPLVARFRRRTP